MLTPTAGAPGRPRCFDARTHLQVLPEGNARNPAGRHALYAGALATGARSRGLKMPFGEETTAGPDDRGRSSRWSRRAGSTTEVRPPSRRVRMPQAGRQAEPAKPRRQRQAVSPSKKVILCRCEDVTLADVEHAVGAGYADLEEVKRYTGFGTGPCQGKECLREIAARDRRGHRRAPRRCLRRSPPGRRWCRPSCGSSRAAPGRPERTQRPMKRRPLHLGADGAPRRCRREPRSSSSAAA